MHCTSLRQQPFFTFAPKVRPSHAASNKAIEFFYKVLAHTFLVTKLAGIALKFGIVINDSLNLSLVRCLVDAFAFKWSQKYRHPKKELAL